LKQRYRVHNQEEKKLDDALTEPSQHRVVDRSRPQRRSKFGKHLVNFIWALIYLLPVLAIFGTFSYLPFFRAIWLSLNITDGVGDPVRFVGSRYYEQILNLDGEHSEYLQSLFASVKFSVMVVVLQILGALILAWLAQARVRGIGIFRTIFTGSIAVSLASASVIWAMIFDPNTGVTTWLIDLLGTERSGLLADPLTALPSIAVMSAWSGLGFNFIIALSGMQAIPEELYESAALDGANRWHSFRYITLPLLSPILLFLLVINTVSSFQAFTQFRVLIDGEGPASTTNVFVYAIFRIFWLDHRYSLASAMSIILFVILLVLSMVQFFGLGRKVHYR
jgi:ABC-type sugar transport system permease subunit